MIKQKIAETTLIIPSELLRKVYDKKLSVILLPLPFVSADDEFTEVKRIGPHGEKIRLHFNGYQLYYDLRIGTHIGFKEDYFVSFGDTYYRMNYPDADELGIFWRPAITMTNEKIRKWYEIKRVSAIRCKYIRGKMENVTGPLHLYPEVQKHDWALLLFLDNV